MESISDVMERAAIPTASSPLPEAEQQEAMDRIASRLEYAQQLVGLDDRHRSYRFDSFEADRQPEAYRKAREFVKGERGSLVFWGNPGVGKTHLACAIVNELLMESAYCTGVWRPEDLQGIVCFTTFDDALRRLRETYRDSYEGMGEGWLLERWRKVPVLVLDEVGQRGREDKGSDFARRIGYDIVDGRYRGADRPLIITTNMNPDQLCNWLTVAGVDRLFEMGDFVEFTGRSHRLDGATERSVEAGNPMEVTG